jgi:hypothetical protein
MTAPSTCGRLADFTAPVQWDYTPFVKVRKVGNFLETILWMIEYDTKKIARAMLCFLLWLCIDL